MDIVNPEKSTYLEEAAQKRMSFSREMSLKRAVSHRTMLVKKDGTLANTQYTDQYVDRGRVTAELRRQASQGGGLSTAGGFNATMRKSLARCVLLIVCR